jgi:hypothetical protein
VDRDGVMDLVAAIVRDAPSLPEAACRGRYQLLDDVPWPPEPRSAAAALRGRGHGLPEVPGTARVLGITVRADLVKRAGRSQGSRWSEALFSKVTGSGQIGHLGYSVCRARVITAAMFPTARELPCSWQRLKDTSGAFEGFITGDAAQGPTTVTISRSDGAFKTSGCNTWQKVG